MTQEGLALKTGYSRQTINQLAKDKHGISLEMSKKLGRATGHPPDFWARTKFEYDAWEINEEKNSAQKSQDYDERSENDESQVEVIPAISGLGSGILVDHQIIQEVANGNIVISGFDEKKHLQAASYDLTIGHPATDNKNKRVILAPGANTIVMAKESLELPQEYCARFGPCSKLTRVGVAVFAGCQIDPGYMGHLSVSMHNFGSIPYELEAGDSFLTIEFHRLMGVPTQLYNGRYQNENQIDMESLAAMMDGQPDFEIEENVLTINRLPDSSLRIYEQIQASITKMAPGEYHATIVEAGAEGFGENENDASEDLRKAICSKFNKLVSESRELAGSAERSLDFLEKHIFVRKNIVSAAKFYSIIKKIGGEIEDKDDSYHAYILGPDDKILASPNASHREGISVEMLADELLVSDQFVYSLIGGKTDREDFVRESGLYGELNGS